MIKNEKYTDLINSIKKMGKIVIAFSGGVDSTFLLKVAKEAIGNNVKAITIKSAYIPDWEMEEAKVVCKDLEIEHQIISVGISDSIKNNPEDRCYICKTFLFSKIIEEAKKQGYNFVADGTNLDDTKDYRPGMKALKELNVRSPLLENKITKQEIRDFSKELGLETWNKPAYACLLTRIPYGNELKVEELKMIEKAEVFMMELGFRAVRVRCHKDLARIEVDKDERERLFDINLFDKISKKLREIGFKYVTMDMNGYRMGSFNQDIKGSN